MPHLAAIDIGTNTVLLLVAEIHASGALEPVIQREHIVRLGEGVDEHNTLQPGAMDRALGALRESVELARQHGAKTILAAATSAVRDATNRREFLSRVRNELDLEVRVLSGDEEAALTYFGALSNKGHLQRGILLIDIGGGSTECIFGEAQTIEQARSLDIGSVRLTERCIRNDPPGPEELEAVRDSVRAALQRLPWPTSAIEHGIGVAGTVTTLAAMQLRLEVYDGTKVDGTRLTQPQVDALVETLASKSLAERRQLPGLPAKRADVILAGGIILAESLRHFQLPEVLVSDRGLRFGLIVDYLRSQGSGEISR